MLGTDSYAKILGLWNILGISLLNNIKFQYDLFFLYDYYS